ncbi:MAG: hypothetical protein M3R43_01280 [Acidobacteriota bacterium]|nr:hypothetical protein [Acidobacteriota bacterium]
MPLYPNAESLIRKNLEALQRRERPPMVKIGTLNPSQLADINANRAALVKPAPPIEDEIVFIGRHL